MSLAKVTKVLGKALATYAVLGAAFLVVSASAESKIRIVRLSEVEGTVQIDRATGDGFDRAFINLPIIEGSRVRTGKDGRAEVEFEDGSALRIAPSSEVDFVRLALGDDGQKFDTVKLVSGTVYANLHPKSSHDKAKTGDQFQLNFGDESVNVAEAAHFRVELTGTDKATVAVFKGKVTAVSPAGQTEIADKHSAVIDFKSDDPAKKDTFVVAKNYETEPSDAWDHQQTDYHDRYASTGGSSNMSSPYAYGLSDLNYYGSFMSLPGYGNVWQPFFIGAGWSPFQDGAWAFYPGGYMFVSGYPWGWMPYNYGNWAFASGYGWVWQPGNWGSFNAAPRVTNAPAKTFVPTAPVNGHRTVMLGLGLSANPPLGTSRKLTINPGSAGYGVPRGSVNHLDHVSRTVTKTSQPATIATAPPPQPPSSNPGWGPGPSSGSGSPSSGSMRGGSYGGMSPGATSGARAPAAGARPH